MAALPTVQPDITLLLDMEGVIREATLSPAMGAESVDGWLGRPWVEIAGEMGGDKVKRMVDDARVSGISAFRQINQRFPSGLEIPMEYTTVLLGGRAGMLAIGKNLQAVAELQSRLIAAQAGLDLAMPGPRGPWGAALVDAVRSGAVAEEVIDDKVLRLLRLARQEGRAGPGSSRWSPRPPSASGVRLSAPSWQTVWKWFLWAFRPTAACCRRPSPPQTHRPMD